MSTLLLESIESMIGLIESWPNEILFYLFSIIPSSYTLRKVCAFFYGNGVPCELAYRLYETCSGRTVTDDVCFWFTWFRTVMFGYGVHLETYYNLRVQKYLYVNGPKLSQCEPVTPKPPGNRRTLIGFQTLLCPETDELLHHVRHVRIPCGTPFCDDEQCCRCICRTCRGEGKIKHV